MKPMNPSTLPPIFRFQLIARVEVWEGGGGRGKRIDTKRIVFPAPALSFIAAHDKDVCRIEFPGPPHRRRRAGWLGQIDPDLSAQTLDGVAGVEGLLQRVDRKSTRLNSSHGYIS